MRTGVDRMPRKGAGFSWCRLHDAGGITYRLYWREHGGRLFSECRLYHPQERRRVIAADLRRVRHNLRVLAHALGDRHE